MQTSDASSQTDGAAQVTQSDFTCPICLTMLYKPCVNACGHVFCHWCIFSAMNHWSTSSCPICRAEYSHLPRICGVLASTIEHLFPAAYAARAIEVAAKEAELGSPAIVQGDGEGDPPPDGGMSGGGGEGEGGGDGREEDGGGGGGGEEGGGDGGGGGHGNQGQTNDEEIEGFGHVDRDEIWDEATQVMEVREEEDVEGEHEQASTVGGVQLGGRFEDFPIDPDTFVHYGVGCDNCGFYPIVGPRHTCEECPQQIGYDICGKCMEKGVKTGGRFSQGHTAGHKMRLVTPRPTVMHVLRTLHPELNPDEILTIFEDEMALMYRVASGIEEEDEEFEE